MFQLSLPERIWIPEVEAAPLPKKSKMLFALIVLALFSIAWLAVLPRAKTPLLGRFAPARPILHCETRLRSLPVVVPVLKMMVPPTVPN